MALEGLTLVTTLGAAPQRVIDLIYEITPRRIHLLNSEEDPRWGKKNPEFKKDVMDKFENDPLIRNFRERKMIEDVPVQTISNPERVFETVFHICSDASSDDQILLDRTGMTSRVSMALENVACCFRNVKVVYETTKSPEKYSSRIYGKRTLERGAGMVEVPIPRVDLQKIRAPGFPQKVFRACYDICKEKGAPKSKALIFTDEVFRKIGSVTKPSNNAEEQMNKDAKNTRIKITQNLNSFVSDGFLEEVLLTGKPYSMTLFALSLGRVLFETGKHNPVEKRTKPEMKNQ